MKGNRRQWTVLLVVAAGGITWFLCTERMPSSVHLPAEIYDVFNTNDSINSPPVYFVVTSEAKMVLRLRVGCAIEAAAKHHKNSLIQILPASAIQDDNVLKTLRNLFNVRIVDVSIGDILSETPLEDWYRNESYKGGKYSVTHLSDAIRIALLWKFGGIYLDTDVWCLKSLANLHNSIGMQSTDVINGAVMSFDKGHPFLNDAMAEFARSYDKNEFTIVGPHLLTKIITKKCNVSSKVDSVPLETYKICYDVTVLPQTTFYPIAYYMWWKYFEVSDETFPDSYTFHLWNQLSRDKFVNVGNGVLLDNTARIHCPNIYKLMEINKTF